MKGWVYVITTKTMPNLVKVGFSTKDPELRAIELNNTGNPHPYKVEYDVLVNNPKNVEQATHDLLKSKNYHENKEWFSCTVREAIAAIKAVAEQQNIQIRDEEFKPKTKAEQPKNAKKIAENLPNNHLDIFVDEQSLSNERSKAFLERLDLAKQGNVEAKYLLGLMYQHGEGINKDYPEAIKYYKEAAEAGHIAAQVKLGRMLYNVSWLYKNYDEALDWFSKAAEQGNAEAQYYCAYMYQRGQGVMRNLKAAEDWYVKAIENGDDAMRRKVIRACLNNDVQ